MKCYMSIKFFTLAYFICTILNVWAYGQMKIQFPAPNARDSNGLKQGFWKYGEPYDVFDGTNQMILAEGFYYNSKKIGVWKKLNKEAKTVEIEIFYDTIQKDAERFLFFESGKIKEKGKISFRPFSDTIEVYNAENIAEIVYIDGVLRKHGFWEFYDINGKLYCDGEYKDDKQVGIWRFYNEDGTISKKEF